jgi:hypothetical protein
MSVHSILLVIPPLKENEETKNTLRETVIKFVQSLLETRKTTETLAENCWMIPVNSDFGLLCQIVAKAEHNHILYKFLSFENEPTWNPKATA